MSKKTNPMNSVSVFLSELLLPGNRENGNTNGNQEYLGILPQWLDRQLIPFQHFPIIMIGIPHGITERTGSPQWSRIVGKDRSMFDFESNNEWRQRLPSKKRVVRWGYMW
jgi:hypothetical protein